MGTFPGWEIELTEDMSGKQLAEVLKYLANRVQNGLDEGADIIDQLKMVARKLEERHGR